MLQKAFAKKSFCNYIPYYTRVLIFLDRPVSQAMMKILSGWRFNGPSEQHRRRAESA